MSSGKGRSSRGTLMESYQRPWMWLLLPLQKKLDELHPGDCFDREHAAEAVRLAFSYCNALRSRHSDLPPMPRRKAGADPFFELQSIIDWLLKCKDMPDSESIENFEAADRWGIGDDRLSELLDELSGLTPRYRLRRLRAKVEWKREIKARSKAKNCTHGGTLTLATGVCGETTAATTHASGASAADDSGCQSAESTNVTERADRAEQAAPRPAPHTADPHEPLPMVADAQRTPDDGTHSAGHAVVLAGSDKPRPSEPARGGATDEADASSEAKRSLSPAVYTRAAPHQKARWEWELMERERQEQELSRRDRWIEVELAREQWEADWMAQALQAPSGAGMDPNDRTRHPAAADRGSVHQDSNLPSVPDVAQSRAQVTAVTESTNADVIDKTSGQLTQRTNQPKSSHLIDEDVEHIRSRLPSPEDQARVIAVLKNLRCIETDSMRAADLESAGISPKTVFSALQRCNPNASLVASGPTAAPKQYLRLRVIEYVIRIWTPKRRTRSDVANYSAG